VNKSTLTLNLSPSIRPENSHLEQWDETRSVFPIYVALAKQLGIKSPFPEDRRALPEKPNQVLFDHVQVWLESMDQQVHARQLRHLLQMTTYNASESGLRALIQRHLRKKSKTTLDRDKIDFLLVQYFALSAPATIYHKQIELQDAAQVMKPVLGEVDSAPLDWCEPLENVIRQLRTFRSVREMLKTNFIEQGRKVKESAGGMFYDPSALLAFVRFNFLMRRTLIELMHADLIVIRAGLTHLEGAGVAAIDCSEFGLSRNEPIAKIRALVDEWKQPFQKEYTERIVNEAFDKLLALRSDVESALRRIAPKEPSSRSAPQAPAAEKQARAKETPSVREPAKPVANRPVKEPIPTQPLVKTELAVDFEGCLEQIWEQLIAAPPSRGRSMTTVKIGSARILMSSWEVTAFVSEDGPVAEDLRRAVVARALITSALEHAKAANDTAGLDQALSVARIEVSRLQERVDRAKQAKDTEAAVNLGISTKRLLTALDEAEKL
jgi:hypothetical protein